MPISNFRMICYADPLSGVPPSYRMHVLDVDKDVAYVGVIAPTVEAGIGKLKALAEFINEFLDSGDVKGLVFDPEKGVFFWPKG
jgi:hypothetical protein